MPNYKFTLEYNGANFAGSQKQPELRTVQSELEKALSGFFQTQIETVFAGRTDAGVHAIGQVVNFCLEEKITNLETNPGKVLLALNSCLPQDMALTKVNQVADDFHARYDAKSREYLYKIFVRRFRPVLRLDSLHWEKEPLDFELMQKQASTYLGKHDFAAYAKQDEGEKSTECEVYKSELIKESDICFKYKIKANRFLRHMVRRIVGELIYVAKGNAANQSSKAFSAPAAGLTLTKIEYSN